jgi:hypothetical protein
MASNAVIFTDTQLCWGLRKANITNHAVSALPWELQMTSGDKANWHRKIIRLWKLYIAFNLHLNCTGNIQDMLEASGRTKLIYFKEQSSFGLRWGVARARSSDTHWLHAFIYNLLLRPAVTARLYVARSLQTFSATPAKREHIAVATQYQPVIHKFSNPPNTALHVTRACTVVLVLIYLAADKTKFTSSVLYCYRTDGVIFVYTGIAQ